MQQETNHNYSLFALSSVVAIFILQSLYKWYSKREDSDVIDPATGLSSREKRHVQQTWALAKKDLKSTGIGLFLAFFKAHPEYQQLFTAFSDVTPEQLLSSGPFLAHAMNVVNALSLIVDSLDDPATLVALLKRVGKSHARHKLTEKHFQNLNLVVVDFLGVALGGKVFTKDCRDSWVHTLHVALSVIEKELN